MKYAVMGTCIVVGAGSFSGLSIEKGAEDYLIGADGGMEHLNRLGLHPDMALGDFDSLGYVPEHENLVLHPTMKNDTDMMLAVKEGLKLGYRRFRLYGGLGGRLDHTIANLQTLVFLSRQGADARLIGEGMCAAAVTGGMLTFDASHKGVISVFCLTGEARGVTLTGLKYPLKNAVLTSDVPLGVSNEFTGEESSVSVLDGTLLVMWGL